MARAKFTVSRSHAEMKQALFGRGGIIALAGIRPSPHMFLKEARKWRERKRLSPDPAKKRCVLFANGTVARAAAGASGRVLRRILRNIRAAGCSTTGATGENDPFSFFFYYKSSHLCFDFSFRCSWAHFFMSSRLIPVSSQLYNGPWVSHNPSFTPWIVSNSTFLLLHPLCSHTYFVTLSDGTYSHTCSPPVLNEDGCVRIKNLWREKRSKRRIAPWVRVLPLSRPRIKKEAIW